MEVQSWEYAELRFDCKREWAFWTIASVHRIKIEYRVETSIQEFYRFLAEKGLEGWEVYNVSVLQKDDEIHTKLYFLKRKISYKKIDK